MLKIIAATTLLAGASTMVGIPAFDSSGTSPRVAKADRIALQIDTGIRNYLSPRLNGNRVAFCLTDGSQCGKEAADAFCRGNGFSEAITFQRDHVQSNSTRLRFRQIKCWHPQVAAGTEQDVITELAGVPQTSNAAIKSNRL